LTLGQENVENEVKRSGNYKTGEHKQKPCSICVCVKLLSAIIST